MRNLPLGLFFLFFSLSTLIAQADQITITGQLIDATSKESLPFASIYLKGTSIGTTSNVEGSFIFHVPAAYKQNPIVISMLGYNSVEKLATDFERNGVIYLEENALSLNAIVVRAEKALTAKQLMKKAYQSISSNYPAEPYVLEGFVRDLQNEDGTYVELVECAVKMRYKENAVQEDPEIELVEVRRSYLTNKHPWNEQFDRKNSIIDIIEDDFIRFDYGPIKVSRKWNYEIESVLPYGDKLVYKVIATNKPFDNAVLYIDMDSYAFVRIEYSRAVHDGMYYKRRLSSGQQEAAYDIVFEYQEYNGKWYLKYQKEEDTWQIFENLESDNLLFTQYPKKELFINKIIVEEEVDQSAFSPNLDRERSVEEQATPYNANFWQYYNAPAQTKALSKIEEELKKAQAKLKE